MKFKHISMLIGVLFVSSTAFVNSADCNAHGLIPKLTAARWQWLEDTYWYVPESNLLAYLLNAQTNELMEIDDQTVYHITDYRNGYFWGITRVQLDSSSQVMCLSLVGSVTPEGQAFLRIGNKITSRLREGEVGEASLGW